ncbi:hypothetical protein SMG44B_20624 [Stenotrophomonas maltophilia]|nr:hypothetical protein BN126390085 [Stenotrophomonas maltophilia]
MRSSASQAKRPHPWGLDGAIHGANGPAPAHPTLLDGFPRHGAEGKEEQKQRAGHCPALCFSSAIPSAR